MVNIVNAHGSKTVECTTQKTNPNVNDVCWIIMLVQVCKNNQWTTLVGDVSIGGVTVQAWEQVIGGNSVLYAQFSCETKTL